MSHRHPPTQSRPRHQPHCRSPRRHMSSQMCTEHRSAGRCTQTRLHSNAQQVPPCRPCIQAPNPSPHATSSLACLLPTCAGRVSMKRQSKTIHAGSQSYSQCLPLHYQPAHPSCTDVRQQTDKDFLLPDSSRDHNRAPDHPPLHIPHRRCLPQPSRDQHSYLAMCRSQSALPWKQHS